MESANHPLALKVTRVSRPRLTNSWQPFFTTSAAFSAHATESLVSLQGEEPSSGHPKTLRDLSHGLELLSLPARFGAIQSGETLTSCVCLNNEAKVDVEFTSLRIEIQTPANQIILLKYIHDSRVLHPGGLLETIVTHEMKETGPYVLRIGVSYRFGHVQDEETFVRYFKFMVANPLSVRTRKVHVPRSASALSEREKIFLEVHVQNLTQEPMWLEQLNFMPIDGWKVLDDGAVNAEDGLFPGSLTILQSQDIRQFVFTLSPESIHLLPPVYAPGSTLGRLDITWRSSMGEPGHLLKEPEHPLEEPEHLITSVLTRRVPPPPPNQTPTAIPPHLQNRPRSPFSRPSTPPIPLSSPSPFKSRPLSQQTVVRSQSPSQTLSSTTAFTTDLEVDLVIHDFLNIRAKVAQPFEIEFQLILAGLMPEAGSKRLIQLVVQHVTSSSTPKVRVPKPSQNTPSSSPRVSTDLPARSFSTRSLHDIDSQASPIRKSPSPLSYESLDSSMPLAFKREGLCCFPTPLSPVSTSSSLIPLGSSIVWLPRLEISHSRDCIAKAENAVASKGIVKTQFRYQFVTTRKGFSTLGSFRIFLVEDHIVRDAETDGILPLSSQENKPVRHLKEWDIISDIWVTN